MVPCAGPRIGEHLETGRLDPELSGFTTDPFRPGSMWGKGSEDEDPGLETDENASPMVAG